MIRRVIAVTSLVVSLYSSVVLASQSITGIGPFSLGMTLGQLQKVLPNLSEAEEAFSKWCGTKAYDGSTHLQLNGLSREVQVTVCVDEGEVQAMVFQWPIDAFSGERDLYDSMSWLVREVERAYGLSMKQVKAMWYFARDEKGSIVHVRVRDQGLLLSMATQKGLKRH